jgi:hypothetical protein
MERFIFLLVTFWASSQVNAQLVPSGLIAHYGFDKSSTKGNYDFVPDWSKSTNHGKIIGTTEYTEDRFGRPCHALKFDGNTYVSVPDSRSLRKPTNKLSISVWVKIARGADFFKQWLTICCKGNQSLETPANPQFRMQATAQTVSMSSDFTENAIPQLKYDTWYFYTYTYDGSVFKAYLNTDLFYEIDYNKLLEENDQPLEIGRDVPGTIEYFFGVMDDLRIYDRELSEGEILKLFRESPQSASDINCDFTDVVSTQSVDTVIPVKVNQIQVTTPRKTDYSNLPQKIENETIVYQDVIEVASNDVTFYAYDNEKEDGDIVSININGVWIKEKYKLKLRKNTKPNPDVIRCTLLPGGNNYLISKAWNVGTIPPNTMTIEIDDKKSVQKVTINSEIGLSGGIKIICKS